MPFPSGDHGATESAPLVLIHRWASSKCPLRRRGASWVYLETKTRARRRPLHSPEPGSAAHLLGSCTSQPTGSRQSMVLLGRYLVKRMGTTLSDECCVSGFEDNGEQALGVRIRYALMVSGTGARCNLASISV